MSALYDVGDTARCTAKVKDSGGVLRDPDTLTFELTKPSGIVSWTYPADPEIVRNAAGDFYIDVQIEEAGAHKYRWSAAGGSPAVPAVRRGQLQVRGV